MTEIVFRIDSSSVANLTPQSKRLLAEVPEVTAADWALDVLCDAFDAYNAARVRCGFETITEFSKDSPA